MRILLAVLLLISGMAFAQTQTTYIAQTSPGTTVGLCDTFNMSAGANFSIFCQM